jgi:anti-sigma28 factor (negative regulator of flagellin synthesis)
MRLHLDTSSTTGSANATEANSALSPAGRSGTALTGTGNDPNLRDSVAVSGASSAWSASFSDRAARVGQLAAAVQSGTYDVPSSAVSQSIIASAMA